MRLAFLAAVLSAGAATAGTAGPFARPQEIRWGASAAAEQQRLSGKCATQRLRRVDPPFLTSVKRVQMQIDCEGFVFEGAPRHAEFVIADDCLAMVWIMHRADEDAPIAARIEKAFGSGAQMTSDGSKYLVFPKQRVALRLDKHEVLFWGPALDAEVGGGFSR